MKSFNRSILTSACVPLRTVYKLDTNVTGWNVVGNASVKWKIDQIIIYQMFFDCLSQSMQQMVGYPALCVFVIIIVNQDSQTGILYA